MVIKGDIPSSDETTFTPERMRQAVEVIVEDETSFYEGFLVPNREALVDAEILDAHPELRFDAMTPEFRRTYEASVDKFLADREAELEGAKRFVEGVRTIGTVEAAEALVTRVQDNRRKWLADAKAAGNTEGVRNLEESALEASLAFIYVIAEKSELQQ